MPTETDKMPNNVDLTNMVNIALNTSPGIGIVNFNVLKSFLLELLKALKLDNFKPNLEENTEIIGLLDSALKESSRENFSDVQFKRISEPASISLDRFQKNEDRINRLEVQIAALNDTPSQEIIRKTKENKIGGEKNDKYGPILEVWQYTQLSKRQESNEEGITKLTTIIQDLIGDMNDIKMAQDKLYQESKGLNGKFDQIYELMGDLNDIKNLKFEFDQMKRNIDYLNGQVKKIDGLKGEIKDISEKISEIDEKMALLVNYSDLEEYTKWNDLMERMLKESNADSLNKKDDFNALLSNLGTINGRHEVLRDEVDTLKIELSKKNNTPNIPSNILEQLEKIKQLELGLEDLENKLRSQSQDNTRILIQDAIRNLNAEIEKLKESLTNLLTRTDENESSLNTNRNRLNQLDETKMDKNWIINEIKNKADLKDINNKLNKNLFEDFNHQMSTNVSNVMLRNDEIASELKATSEALLKELENKLDRLEIDALRDQIEKQLKKLKKLKNAHEAQSQYNVSEIGHEDEAAGLRKQLLKFHCISCDRPIDINNNQGPIPSLPQQLGMRPIQTPRPYTTYELDQIRQYQKQQFMTDAGYDLFSTVRQCGGSHTLTIPHKKMVKVTGPPEIEPTTPTAVTPVLVKNRTEVQIQGQDGQIYKGRLDSRLDAKLSVEMKKPEMRKHQNRFLKSAPAPVPNENDQTLL